VEDPSFCDPRGVAIVLDSVDACIHVADMETHKILFINRYGKNIWGDIKGKPCWSAFHQGMTGPCEVCINKRLVDEKNNLLGVHPWEYFSPINNRWYDCRGRAIRSPDGRLVTVKVATDITERKQAQEEFLRSAKRLEKVRELDRTLLANTSPGDVASRVLEQAQLLERVAEYSRDLERKIEERTGALEVLNSLLRNDLNKRKRVIEELRQSEERYRIAIESSNDGVAIIKGEKIVFANRRYNDIFGYDDPGEMHGKDLSLTIHPDDAAAVRERNARLQLGEDVSSKYECKGFRKDGGTVYVEASAAPISYQGARASLVYIRDITERKEAEERLRKSEKQYRDLVENSLVGIYQTDMEGNIIYVNHALAKMLGYDSPDEVRCEKACRYYTDPKGRRGLVKRLSKVRKIPGIELELSTRSGERKSVLLSAALEGDTLSGMAKDITLRKKAEEELKEKSLSCEEANAALRVLLRQRDRDRNEVEQKILGNVKELIHPYLDKLRLMQITEEQKTCLDIIESNIRDIISPFMQKMTAINLRFTPAEIRVAAFIRDGKTVKEISGILAVSESAVNLHRQHIRDKLSLTGKKINLRTFLLSLQ